MIKSTIDSKIESSSSTLENLAYDYLSSLDETH